MILHSDQIVVQGETVVVSTVQSSDTEFVTTIDLAVIDETLVKRAETPEGAEANHAAAIDIVNTIKEVHGE